MVNLYNTNLEKGGDFLLLNLFDVEPLSKTMSGLDLVTYLIQEPVMVVYPPRGPFCLEIGLLVTFTPERTQTKVGYIASIVSV